MLTGILRRTGAGLVALGVAGVAVAITGHGATGAYPAAFGVLVIAAGIFLWFGGPRAALWVRSLVVFLLAAGLTPLVMAPFFQPPTLTLAEIRAYGPGLALEAAGVACGLLVLGWVVLELGRAPVRDAIASSRARRWSMQIPAQAGAGAVLLAGLLGWLSLHGQSAVLAESLALQQLGPAYRYHLSWISSTSNGRGTSVTGVVTAWNATEVKTVLLHWETH